MIVVSSCYVLKGHLWLFIHQMFLNSELVLYFPSVCTHCVKSLHSCPHVLIFDRHFGCKCTFHCIPVTMLKYLYAPIPCKKIEITVHSHNPILKGAIL